MHRADAVQDYGKNKIRSISKPAHSRNDKSPPRPAQTQIIGLEPHIEDSDLWNNAFLT
jgi:hypothetical protein